MTLNPENSQANDRIYFPELDGLRFFAFLLVFIHHHPFFGNIPYLSFFHKHGGVGVDLFFVLSAFLFTKLLIAEYNKTQTISFKKFYIRRIFRIWPIYYLFVAAVVSLYYFKNGAISEDIKTRLFGLLTFTDNIFTSINGFNSIPFTSHLWTIAFEEQFYIFIPFLIYFLVKSSFKTKISALISSFFIFSLIKFLFIYNAAPHPTIWALPITHFESIMFGIIIGFGGFDFLLKKINALLIGVISLFLFLLLKFLTPYDETTYLLFLTLLLVGVSMSFILFSVLNNSGLKKFLSGRFLVFMGKRSYGLYLYHIIANGTVSFMILHIQGMPSHPAFTFILSLIITITLSVISYKIIETPFLKLKKKFEVIISRPI